jgi:hypothetical protein
MNGLLKVPYAKTAFNHGPALIMSWPGHLIDSSLKQAQLHDCNGNSPCFKEGWSNIGLFSDPSEAIDKHLKSWGYEIHPDIEKENTGYNDLFSLLLKDLDDPKIPNIDKIELTNFFKMIQSLASKGLSGLEAVKQLKIINTPSADLFARYIVDIVAPDGDPLSPAFPAVLESNLEKMRITLVPSRIERYLEKIRVDNVRLKLKVGENVVEKVVYSLAIGDSLASTDFLSSAGTNRAFSTAIQIFRMGKDAERVFEELIRKTIPSIRGDYNEIVYNAQKWLYESATLKSYSRIII